MELLHRVTGPVATNVWVLGDEASREALAVDTATPCVAWLTGLLASALGLPLAGSPRGRLEIRIMKRFVPLFALAALACLASSAFAWHVSGTVFCDASGLPLGGVSIVASSSDGAGFTGTATTGDDGTYFISLPDVPGCYTLSASLGAGESVITPAGNSFAFCASDGNSEFGQDFVISSPACANEGCWLTGGGAKFSTITDTFLGSSNNLKKNKLFNWGGNVNPGCSPTAGQGGQWNLLDAVQKLHFHGTAIQVVRCGNVDGIPPGSTSPATPFNFIEYTGTGNVKGIQGNKTDLPLVYFFARAEDRNEPGSNGQSDGAGKDRLFVNVYTNPADPVGSSIILVDMDGDPSTVDPLIISDGNLQIHVSSCSTPALAQVAGAAARVQRIGDSRTSGASLPAEISFASPFPNPTGDLAVMRYALPREANVSLAVYDVMGRAVRQLESGFAAAGMHSTTWDLKAQDGSRVERGVYFLRLAVGNQTFTRTLNISR